MGRYRVKDVTFEADLDDNEPDPARLDALRREYVGMVFEAEDRDLAAELATDELELRGEPVWHVEVRRHRAS